MAMLKLEQKVEELERGIKELQKELESEKVVLICVLDRIGFNYWVLFETSFFLIFRHKLNC